MLEDRGMPMPPGKPEDGRYKKYRSIIANFEEDKRKASLDPKSG
jgi:hypothetical protein